LTELVIRDARVEDCTDIADIYEQSVRSGRSTMDTGRRKPTYFQQMLGRDDREALLVGIAGDKVVGWAVVKRYSDRPGYRFACETSIYMAEDCQDGGLGSELFGATMARARGLGYRHVVAKVLAANDASIRFLLRFGYEIVGRQRSIGYLNGSWQDVMIMQLVFDEFDVDVEEGT
jgi:phosphinothricin acetyltransferase